MALKQLLSRIVMLSLVSIGIVSAVGCNTMEGAGKDVERAGEAVQDAAD